MSPIRKRAAFLIPATTTSFHCPADKRGLFITLRHNSFPWAFSFSDLHTILATPEQ